MPSETVSLQSADDHIAVVTLNRASSGNAITESMAFELREVCESVNQDDEIWIAIVTGSGNDFCIGADASAIDTGAPLESLRRLKVAGGVARIDKPVIAAINGDAIDQGLELALACDIRIASNRARFGLTHAGRGIMPSDGGTQRLPRLIGRGRATEMILTSRIVSAEEALEIGLVNQIVEPEQVLEQAKETASTIANHGPIAARYLKETVLKGMDMTLEQGLRLEADLNFILQSTSDRVEGISSFLERRSPQFRGE